MAGVTYNPGMESLRTGLAQGDMKGTITDTKAWMKAQSGDFKLDFDTANVSRANTAAAWTQDVTLGLYTGDGELHKWYSGYVNLAVSDTGADAAVATISPSGNAMMNDGKLAITVSGNTATWGAGNTVTVVANPISTNGGLFTAGSNDNWVLSFT